MTQANHSKSKKAKTTPASKKAAGQFHISYYHGVIIAIVVLVALNAALFCAYSKVQSLTSQQNTIIALNEQKTYGDVTITASDVQIETGYVMGITPQENEKIISTQLTIVNNSDEDFEFYPTAQTYVRDNQGSQYIMAPVELQIPFAGTTIKPGETKTGQVSYLVTNRTVPLFLYIESRQDSAGPFVIKLQ